MQEVDQIIHARWLIPVEPDDSIFEHYSIVIHQGIILDILATQKCIKKYHSAIEHHFSDHALLPGFINTHTHAAMSLMRGVADDIPLMEWLTKYIWPAETQCVNYNFVKEGTELAIAEMLRGGTTTFNDMYFFPDAAARAAEQTGIRACVGLIVIDFPSAWAKDGNEYLQKGLKLYEQYRHHPHISTAFAPHAPYTVSDELLTRLCSLAEELEIPVHIHLHETSDEIQQALADTGMRPVARLEKLGLLSPSLVAVHMTQLEDDEFELLQRYGVNIVHCPESNMKLGSGFCPVSQLLDKQLNIAIGTDGAASNNDLDMLGELQTAALLAKALSSNASVMPAGTALKMATLNGAKALGIDHITGSLKKGKAADIIAIDLGAIETQPVYHPLSQIVYSAGREQITDVWVQGRHLLKNRKLTTIDQEKVKQQALKWKEVIGGSVKR